MQVSRRAVLVAGLTLPLAGCGVRIGAPPGEPPVPPADPAGPTLLAERGRVAEALAVASRVDAPFARAVRPVHADQLTILDSAFGLLEPPIPAPGTPATTATGAAALATSAELAEAESAGLDEAGRRELESLSPRFASLVLASHVQRAVAHEMLTGVGATAAPEVATPEIGLRLLDAHRSAAYGLEVAAVHLPAARREAVGTALADLRRAETGLADALPDAPPRPPGYALPTPVTNEQDAARLVDGVLDRLVQGIVAAAGPTAEALGIRAESDDEGGDEPAGENDSATATPAAAGTAMATLLDLARAAEVARVRCGGALSPGVMPRTIAPDPQASSGDTPAVSPTG